MDLAGTAAARHTLTRTAAIFVLLICCPGGMGQLVPVDPEIARAKELLAQERWQEIVNLAHSVPAPSAELDFYLGTAQARLGRLEDARKAFQAGARLRPSDERFPVELAGVAFKQKLYPEATRYLHRALELAPNDSYANDFLGTVYFLQGNLDAALKYWNRTGKPQIAEITSEPRPRLDPVLLDRAFAFSPASTLRLADLRTTEARTDALGIFPRYHFDLQAREDGKFSLLFRNQEKNGWGRNKWEGLILLFRGLPWQSINPEFYNLQHRAINFVSMWRWDAEKRRVFAVLSAPLGSKPGMQYGLNLDLRSENWNIRDSFSGPAPLLGSLNLRREAIGAQFASVVSGRWNWSAGGELSHRDFRSVFQGVALTDNLLARGYQLKQLAQVGAEIWDLPEKRITLNGSLSSEAGRIWSQPGHAFLRLQPSLRFHWFPLSQGDDYEIQHQLRAGKTLGDVPFDELFMLGLDPDSDLWMRGHIATRSGRKGSGPLGRNYFLSNWEADKSVYRNGLLNLKLGPFVDTGKVTDSLPGLGSHKWLWDAGAQLKVRMLGFGVVLSYGKDLRSGNNAWYVSMLR
jgi:tetratricopeptide (TPR) repeat protein